MKQNLLFPSDPDVIRELSHLIGVYLKLVLTLAENFPRLANICTLAETIRLCSQGKQFERAVVQNTV